MELSRRELFRLLGVSTGAGIAGAWGATNLLSNPDEIFERALNGPRQERRKSSICTHCPGGCGIWVRLIDGIPVRISVNPLYPVNRGSICPMAEASIEKLFHPQRLHSPLKRSGMRGQGEWEEISWEKSLSTLAELQELHSRSVFEKLILLTREGNDLTTALSRRFTKVFGSPNFYLISESEVDSLPVFLSQRLLRQPPVYDLAYSDFVLNFGGDFLDEGPSPIRFAQLYAGLRSRMEGARIRIIHVSSIISRTAANSTRWIPVKPGTMGALALSLAHVMIREESCDRNFIEQRPTSLSD